MCGKIKALSQDEAENEVVRMLEKHKSLIIDDYVVRPIDHLSKKCVFC
jgi:DNA replication protein DnaC